MSSGISQRISLWGFGGLFLLMAIDVGCAGETQVEGVSVKQENKMVEKSEQEWRSQLTPEQFQVLRESGTERAFTGEYTDTETLGTYVCAGCDAKLFQSIHKFHSGCGWPSFYLPFEKGSITKHSDFELERERVEIRCATCGGHLGHVFEDGPPPTGLRYCINSVALKLKESPQD